MRRSIGIQLTIPLYSGGMVSSQVRQAVYQHRAAKERGDRMARQTAHDARDSRRLWIQARTDYSRSRYDYITNVPKLQQAAGIFSE